ncbi:uncharacterized protein YoxC [Evansella vedderi]|uniref:Uncharacterized protein YoxC n=1 Tax=Evansella vedderi TaxID=38282 RepID=A0ABT9ZXY6_9BACI|nr:DUF948 domain-containing protein [Evansella vedderi]MDQ0254995.1 uncharacterized protein YoxC [Evansella vedderi]
MENLLYVSVAIVAVAFAVLVYYLIKTLIAMRITLDNVSSTVEGLQQQVDTITKESTELLHKTNLLADDIQRKSDSLNSIFSAAKDLGESVQRINYSVKRVSEAVSKKADEQSEQVAQAVKWGNVALQFWEKWQAKKDERNKKENSESF